MKSIEQIAKAMYAAYGKELARHMDTLGATGEAAQAEWAAMGPVERDCWIAAASACAAELAITLMPEIQA